MSGNVFPDTSDVGRDEVPEILSRVSALLPSNLEMQPNIGSAGFKSESGDMDLFLDQQQLIDAKLDTIQLTLERAFRCDQQQHREEMQ